MGGSGAMGDGTSGATVAFISAPGGTGKTTLSLHFSYYLVKEKRLENVLVVDVDPSAGLTLMLFMDKYEELIKQKRTLPHMMEDMLFHSAIRTIDDYVQSYNLHGAIVNVLPCCEYLSTVIYRGMGEGRKVVDFLKTVLRDSGAYDKYDLIVLDVVPFFERIYTSLALYAADRYAVVVTPTRSDLVRTRRMLDVLINQMVSERVVNNEREALERFAIIFNKARGGEKSIIEGQTSKAVTSAFVNALNKLRSMGINEVGIIGYFVEIPRFLEGKAFKSGSDAQRDLNKTFENLYNWILGNRGTPTK